MKIAIDCRMYKSSGIGTYIREILPYLLENKNNKFLLIGFQKDLEDYKNYENVEIQICEIPIFSIKEFLMFPVKKINKYDIFYTPNYNIPGKIKIPIYSTIHDVLFLDMPELTSKLGYLIRKFFYKRAYFLSKKIFTVSNFSKERIKYHLGNKKKIIVTYNGISKYILEKDETIYEKKDYIIYVGNIKKHKGLKNLLLAYEEGKKEGLKSKLIIVGNQENFKTKDNEVLEILKNSKNKDIIFTGYVDNKELKKLIAEAKVLVQPSLYEGFGIPPLEAIALKTPALVSNIEVFNELYLNLKNIYIYKDKNELKNKMMNILFECKIDILEFTYKKVAKKIENSILKDKEII